MKFKINVYILGHLIFCFELVHRTDGVQLRHYSPFTGFKYLECL